MTTWMSESRGEVCFFPTRQSTVSSKRVEALRDRVLHDYHDPSQLKYLRVYQVPTRLLDVYFHDYYTPTRLLGTLEQSIMLHHSPPQTNGLAGGHLHHHPPFFFIMYICIILFCYGINCVPYVAFVNGVQSAEFFLSPQRISKGLVGLSDSPFYLEFCHECQLDVNERQPGLYP